MNYPNPSIPDSVYQVDYRPYRRQFREPLRTRHGIWRERQGIILQVFDPRGRVGLGEIAPLPWFGSETWEQALAWCETRYAPAPRFLQETEGLVSEIPESDLLDIPDSHPACQFGVESALMMLRSPPIPPAPVPHCYLLPTGAIALQSWQQPWQVGSRTFKWKIGVTSVTEELAWCKQLLQALPPTATLRLDANGGLDWDTACHWLEMCDRLSSANHASIEFLEQPLPPSQFADLLALSQRFQTAIALDESVSTFQQLQTCYERGWRGIVVIKAAIAGFPSRLLQFCQAHQLDVVWSSVFETAIARQFILGHMVPAFTPKPRTLGFGVQQWFTDYLSQHNNVENNTENNTENVWMSLCEQYQKS
ncbi:MAG: o-succinylbenzoate synthase [Cyanothece sp. SIO2G6]|nr:o-succinylbenzoate synthase [Cyanothece sp. SIO2G6]